MTNASLCLFSLQAGHTPESQRSYLLRKRSTPATERTTFVCYTCGQDTPSSQLRLVYCCPNAEREPYYPFIKTMKVYKNASPISPQGEFSKQRQEHILRVCPALIGLRCATIGRNLLEITEMGCISPGKKTYGFLRNTGLIMEFQTQQGFNRS